jgi:hypothetical protein
VPSPASPAPPLTPEQIDYIAQQTNDRGAAHNPSYVFNDAQLLNNGSALHVGAKTADGGYHAGKANAPGAGFDWLSDPGKFNNVVDKAIDGCERHMQ